MVSRVLFSSASDHWSTPTDVYLALHKEFDFTYDPCPLRCEYDGLQMKWGKRVFCNPPYSNIAAFLEKSQREMDKGKTKLSVFLIPSRTDTKWFHKYVVGQAEIRFCKGRLKFGNAVNSAPFPSMICIFRKD